MAGSKVAFLAQKAALEQITPKEEVFPFCFGRGGLLSKRASSPQTLQPGEVVGLMKGSLRSEGPDPGAEERPEQGNGREQTAVAEPRLGRHTVSRADLLQSKTGTRLRRAKGHLESCRQTRLGRAGLRAVGPTGVAWSARSGHQALQLLFQHGACHYLFNRCVSIPDI